MELYYKFQPITWFVGVIDASPKEVATVIQPLYIPYKELEGIYQEAMSIDKGLSNLEPLGGMRKFLLVETIDGRTVLFNTFVMGAVELPTTYAAENLDVSSYYVCNVPNTISKDQYSGAWGARKIEYRIPGNTISEEPTFGIHLINDCGKWCFYRYGSQPFEDEKAYKSYRKTSRFTEKMLVDYCEALGVPVYDRDFYTDNSIIIQRKPRPNEKGLTYEEAAVKLRISQKSAC